MGDNKSRDTVKVFCRLRPLKDDEESTCIKLLTPTTLLLRTPPESKSYTKELQCKFSHIFTSFSDQSEIFQHVAYPLLEDLINGKNALLFTYGITGSGKTYTLNGDHKNPGIIPKTIHTIFNSIGDYQAPKFVIKSDRMNGFEVQSETDALQDKMDELRSSRTPRSLRKEKLYINDGTKILSINQNNLYSVFVSYIEIYNNTVYDLLDENTGKTIQGKILREDPHKNMYVNGVVEVEVKSSDEAFEVFNIGQKRKKMASTILNAVSSRSHSIFNIRIVQFQHKAFNENGQEIIPESNQLKIAQLSLVDLAGSERTNRTQNTGKLLKEASQINNSLLSLRNCLDILRENQLTGSNKLVPYRDSRLTLLFKNYFEGEGNISMIVCVNPSVEDYEENLQVMKFAEATQDIRIERNEGRCNTPATTPLKKTIHKKATTTTAAAAAKCALNLGPKLSIPNLSSLNYSDLLSNLEKLSNLVDIRRKKTSEFVDDLNKKMDHFRKRLVDVDQTKVVVQQKLKNTNVLLQKERQKAMNLGTKMIDLESTVAELKAKQCESVEKINNLEKLNREKDWKIKKLMLEEEKTNQQLALSNERMTHELDAKLRRQREHLQANMKAKDLKIQKIREFLDQEASNGIEKKDDQVFDYDPQQTPQQQKQQQHVPRKIAPTTSTTSRRRRSKSAGAEKWLEHNAVKPVPLGTVFQPTMNKRKSVTKLEKASDITDPKQSKYCLIAQEHDTDGELETKLYKGDILPTCSGGAQVVFNDVERLRQESPTREK